jgi:hypothetical protein
VWFKAKNAKSRCNKKCVESGSFGLDDESLAKVWAVSREFLSRYIRNLYILDCLKNTKTG